MLCRVKVTEKDIKQIEKILMQVLIPFSSRTYIKKGKFK